MPERFPFQHLRRVLAVSHSASVIGHPSFPAIVQAASPEVQAESHAFPHHPAALRMPLLGPEVLRQLLVAGLFQGVSENEAVGFEVFKDLARLPSSPGPFTAASRPP
jgi:hypothetical protein